MTGQTLAGIDALNGRVRHHERPAQPVNPQPGLGQGVRQPLIGVPPPLEDEEPPLLEDEDPPLLEDEELPEEALPEDEELPLEEPPLLDELEPPDDEELPRAAGDPPPPPPPQATRVRVVAAVKDLSNVSIRREIKLRTPLTRLSRECLKHGLARRLSQLGWSITQERSYFGSALLNSVTTHNFKRSKLNSQSGCGTDPPETGGISIQGILKSAGEVHFLFR